MSRNGQLGFFCRARPPFRGNPSPLAVGNDPQKQEAQDIKKQGGPKQQQRGKAEQGEFVKVGPRVKIPLQKGCGHDEPNSAGDNRDDDVQPGTVEEQRTIVEKEGKDE